MQGEEVRVSPNTSQEKHVDGGNRGAPLSFLCETLPRHDSVAAKELSGNEGAPLPESL